MKKSILLFLIFSFSLLFMHTTALTSGRFNDNGNGTITDTKTGLIWQQDGKISGKLRWNDAWAYCKKLLLAGYSDWRLPKIDELKSLLNIKVGTGTKINEKHRDVYLNNNGFKNIQASQYWSASTYVYRDFSAYSVLMYNGLAGDDKKSKANYVLAVRSMP